MRKTSLSSKCCSTVAFSSRADARSRPNGFSTISLVQPSAVRRLPSASTTVPKTANGMASELLPEGRRDLGRELDLVARGKAGEQRRGDHRRRHVLVDGLVDRP